MISLRDFARSGHIDAFQSIVGEAEGAGIVSARRSRNDRPAISGLAWIGPPAPSHPRALPHYSPAPKDRTTSRLTAFNPTASLGWDIALAWPADHTTPICASENFRDVQGSGLVIPNRRKLRR